MEKNISVELMQRELCAKYKTDYESSPLDMIMGVSKNVKTNMIPLNGLRHPITDTTTGWYIWAGEGAVPSDVDFFDPVHVAHVVKWRPEIVKFLGLPPGWRFLTDGVYEDVWEDKTLLDV